mmetsp:Transcript_107944/g.186169  ORF Transcript_107944/g.186169 Transcript_107944/m.186169 type:complete len:85 (+) Transcript_107944:2225-2479(+)
MHTASPLACRSPLSSLSSFSTAGSCPSKQTATLATMLQGAARKDSQYAPPFRVPRLLPQGWLPCCTVYTDALCIRNPPTHTQRA